MKIAGISYSILWKDKLANFQILEKLISETLADLIILPEMFATGFCMDAEGIADRKNETLLWMQMVSNKYQKAICGSVSVADNGKFYNRLYFVQPNGQINFYNKRHLFSYSGEDKVYTPGKERVIVKYKEFKILLQICYDLRFPVFSRNQADYDAVIFVANWPKSRVEAWTHLLKARAIENQSYVIGINRIGLDGNDLEYTESSHVFSADGNEISILKNQIIFATLDLESLYNFRRKFPFLKDKDNFTIE